MNNIPGDIVRTMGAEHVIAVNVGNLNDKTEIDYSLLGLVMETLDAMMRANTLKAASGADIMINVPVEEFGSLDWRRAPQLIAAGYQGAEADEGSVVAAGGERGRVATVARQAAGGAPPDAAVAGVRPRRRRRAGRHRAHAEGACRARRPAARPRRARRHLHELGGLDRYETLSWSIVEQNGADGLLVTARPKNYGPPFMYLGISLENTTGNEFRFGLAGRYLAFDVFGSGSETRIDASIGSDPSFGGDVVPAAGIERDVHRARRRRDVAVVERHSTTATPLRSTRARAPASAIDGGVNAGRYDEVRAGLRYGWSNANISIGDPGLPELEGEDSHLHHAVDARRAGRRDRAVARACTQWRWLRHYFSAPVARRGGGRGSDERGRDAVPGRGVLAQVARSAPGAAACS